MHRQRVPQITVEVVVTTALKNPNNNFSHGTTVEEGVRDLSPSSSKITFALKQSAIPCSTTSVHAATQRKGGDDNTIERFVINTHTNSQRQVEVVETRNYTRYFYFQKTFTATARAELMMKLIARGIFITHTDFHSRSPGF